MAGVVPACRTLDVVSVFALSVADAAEVMALIEGDDEAPAFQSHALRRSWLGESGRPLRIAVPAAPDCDRELGYAGAFDDAVLRLRQLGAQVETIAMDALFDVAALLYDGPWVAERYAVVRELIESSPDAIDPVVRQVISAARRHDAVSAFEARYRLEDLRQRVAPMWQRFDLLVVPTAPTCPTLAAVAAEPVLRNSELGRFTNFVNLLGMCAISLPSGFTAAGLPFGITAIAPGGSDAALAVFGARWEAASALPLGAHLRRPGDPPTPTPLRTMPAAAATLQIAVVGAHLQGLPLHSQLVERGCRLVDKTTTSACYRLCALPRTTPAKPGLARLAEGEAGSAIEVEVYEMPLAEVGSLLALIAPPLGLGSVELADGRWVKGFVCEGAAIAGAVDISGFGGWRAYLASR
jgi:allophanate hydrolase